MRKYYKKISPGPGLFFPGGKKGSALIAQLIALGIMSISGVVLYSYMKGASEQTQNVAQSQSITFNIHSHVLSQMQALLISTNIDKSGTEIKQKTEGICSLLKPPKKAAGVELIQLEIGSNLSTAAQASLSADRWAVFFDKSEYALSSDDRPCKAMYPQFQSNEFSRCFQYVGKSQDTANEVYVVARIVPRSFPDFSLIDRKKPQTLDAKTVLFELQSYIQVFEGNKNTRDPTKQYGLIWANAVTECHVKSINTNKLVVVQFSGSGPGRLSRNIVINSSFFIDPKTCSDLEFMDIAPHTRVSHTVQNGEVGLKNIRVRMACRKKEFHCKNKSGSSEYNPVIFNPVFFQ